jgi:hypothetical protein
VEGEKITFWMLATADYLLSPSKGQSVMVKGRAEAIVWKGKIERFAFWPLNPVAIEELQRATDNSRTLSKNPPTSPQREGKLGGYHPLLECLS